MGCAQGKTAVVQGGNSPASAAAATPAPQLPPPATTASGGEPSTQAAQPHQGNRDTESRAAQAGSIFPTWAASGKHVMLSYQWDSQEQVKTAYSLLTRKGVPVWMDINGGMSSDIYDSMAEGVQNAAVVVCFMTKQYQDSKNCALELKFAAQSGVPIVPVMAQAEFTISGWLGILTAGLLWTRMGNESTLDKAIDGLIVQITEAVDPESRDGAALAEAVSTAETKSELLRLQQATGLDERVADQHILTKALIPPLVPALPPGVLVTPAMQQLQSKLSDPSLPRVGFVGMGGVGKTVISSWLVRQDTVREVFDKIVWVPLGQSPDLDSCQRSVYEQLVGGTSWDTDATDNVKISRLSEAFRGKPVLLVLDDLWDEKDELCINCVDENTASKVLVSSRVRQVVMSNVGSSKDLSGDDDRYVVQIDVPDDKSAVDMLLSTAGIASGTTPPPTEALQIVKFCNRLPLSISIAGKLVKDLGLGADESWDGIVQVLQEEFDDGGRKSVEESVIMTSLKSITGSHKDNVTALFKCLAIIPEDTAPPLDILTLVFQAGCSTADNRVKRPRIMMLRRWLKVLMDRSLLLGTIDAIQLHDIVRDFTISMHEGDELRQAHRRLIDLLRENRPPGPALLPAWTFGNEIGTIDQNAKYVANSVMKHVRESIGTDWETDMLIVDGWLGDCPQDIISYAVGEVLGLPKLEELIHTAEVAGDLWTLGRRAIIAGHVAKHQGNPAASLAFWRKGLDACEKISAEEIPLEQRQSQEFLEIVTLGVMSGANDPQDASRIPRMLYLVEQEHLDRDAIAKCMCQVFITVMSMFGDLSTYTGNFKKVAEILSRGAGEHPNQRMATLCKFMIANMGMAQPCYSMPDWDWDAAFLDKDGNSFVEQAYDIYDFDSCHASQLREQGGWGLDSFFSYIGGLDCLAYHYGNLSRSIEEFETRMGVDMDKLLAQPEQKLEAANKLLTPLTWVNLVLDFNLPPGRLRGVLEKLDFTISTFDNTVDALAPFSSIPIRPRGETTEGFAMSAEFMGWQGKACCALLSDNTAEINQFCDTLPSWEDHLAMARASMPFVWAYVVFGENSALPYYFALVLEKAGRFDEALAWAERLATLDDPTQGGNMSVNARARGLVVQGRCLAAKGRAAEAEEALSAAAEKLSAIGWWLGEVLALRDLLVCVLRPADREAEGVTRLKASIGRLLGVEPAQKELGVLDTCLGESVDLATVMS